MTDQPFTPDRPKRLAWPVLWAAVGAGLLWAYWTTLAGMVYRWSHDPRYSHGYLVPVFAAIVLWFRLDNYPREPLRLSWWGVPLLGAGAVLRLFAAYYYFDWLDALSLLPTAAGGVLLFGGWPLLRWAWPATAFLVFMLPLPYQAEVALAHPLQRLATTASTYALQTLGFPAVAEGNIILIDQTRIGVLEACSGMGMLVTFFALSTAVAFVIQRPLVDKLVVFASAIPIGVLMNLLRITVTGVLHQTVGSKIANTVFHDLAGWLMMPLALGVLWLELRLLERLLSSVESTGPVPVFLPPTGTATPAISRHAARPPADRYQPIETFRQ